MSASHLPLSLYVHLPWCLKKCPYCDFNSHALDGPMPEAQYIQALIQEVQTHAKTLGTRRLRSIFLGGGTPSLFSPQSIAQLLDAIRTAFSWDPAIEITMEANPGTFEAERFKAYFQLGINRLSIGIQSFSDDHLKRLGRVHDGGQAHKAIEMAIDAGFTNFNLDLMHGLPEQDLKMALSDLEHALKWGPSHVSWYQLTLEPKTAFYHRPPILPDDEACWAIQEAGFAYLKENGFDRYEISAFTQHRPCQHNVNYWQFGDYLGIGAGACSKLSDPHLKRHFRIQNTQNPKRYMSAISSQKTKYSVVKPEDLMFEYMLNTLRLMKGQPFEAFSQYTFLEAHVLKKPLEKAIDKGLIYPNLARIQPTPLGFRFHNELLMLFLEGSHDHHPISH